MKKNNKKSAKKTTKATAKTAKVRTPKAPKAYLGKPIEASRLYRRVMPQFKNCKAEVYLAVNDNTKTTTYMNVYNGILPISYDPATYTYAINEKVLAKKLEEMAEVEDRDEWPTFVISAGAAKTTRRKAAK